MDRHIHTGTHTDETKFNTGTNGHCAVLDPLTFVGGPVALQSLVLMWHLRCQGSSSAGFVLSVCDILSFLFASLSLLHPCSTAFLGCWVFLLVSWCLTDKCPFFCLVRVQRGFVSTCVHPVATKYWSVTHITNQHLCLIVGAKVFSLLVKV